MNYNERRRLDVFMRIVSKISESIERDNLKKAAIKRKCYKGVALFSFALAGFLSMLAGDFLFIEFFLLLDLMWHVSTPLIKYKVIGSALVAKDLIDARKDRIYGPGETEKRKQDEEELIYGLKMAHHDFNIFNSNDLKVERLIEISGMCFAMVSGALIAMVALKGEVGFGLGIHSYALPALAISVCVISGLFAAMHFTFKKIILADVKKVIDDSADSEL